MAKISIQDMAAVIADKHGLSQQEAETFVSAFFDLINEGLHSDKVVKVKGLGTFKIIDVRDRESVNVNTGERVIIEGHGKISFVPDPIMRDLVNKPFSQFETVVLNDGVELEELNSANAVDMQEEGDSFDEDEEALNNFETSEKESAVTINAVEDGLDEDEDKDESANSDIADVTGTAVTMPVTDESVMEEEHSAFSKDDTSMPEEPVLVDEDNTQPGESCNTMDEGEAGLPVDESASMENASYESSSTGMEGNDEDNSVKDEETYFSRNKRLCLSFSALFIAVVFFISGYCISRITTGHKVKYVKVYVTKVHVTKPAGAALKQIKDTATTKQVPVVEKVDTDSASRKKEQETVKDINNTASKGSAGTNDAVLKDARLRVNTGAYRIVGTESVITVKKGDDIRKISKFYLGDGMECYVQVHNGISEVKEGLKLKIPKLEHKKKRK